MANINYSSGPRIVTEGGHRVYARNSWALPWIEQSNLTALESQWNAAPQFNSALLRWDTGAIIQPGDTAPTLFGTWIGRGQFVRIDWTCDDGSILRWVGYIDASSWPTDAFGEQTLVCYGLERSLALTPILDAVWRADLDTPQRSPLPLAFNAEGKLPGRRSTEPVEDDVYAFAAVDDEGELWSTREIVRHLLTYHLPTSTFGVAAIPWAPQQIEQLPDWDQPEVHTRGRTVWDVLNDLVRPYHLTGFTVGSDGADVYVRFFTHLAGTLDLTGATIPANPNQHSLVFAPDALTEAQLSDVGGGYDQVICRGARRQTICTLRAGTELKQDWTPEQVTTYNAGDSATTGYDALDEAEKRQRNAAARVEDDLRPVFRTLILDPEWDYTINLDPIFIDPDNPQPLTLELLPRLPIRANVAWDGAVDQGWLDRRGEGRPLLLRWDAPDSLTGIEYVDNAALESLSDIFADDVFSDFSVRADTFGRKLHLHCDGGPQHLIGGSAFSKLPADEQDSLLDIATAAVTVAIAEDRHCEAAYPAYEDLGVADVIRRLVVDLGDGYQHIRIHPGTVSGITAFTGAEKTSDGGDLVNDTQTLESLARTIAESVLITRKTVRWRSLRKISSVAVGDLITTASGATIMAPVSSVHIRSGVQVNRPASASIQSFEVYRGAVDPLRLVDLLS